MVLLILKDKQLARCDWEIVKINNDDGRILAT